MDIIHQQLRTEAVSAQSFWDCELVKKKLSDSRLPSTSSIFSEKKFVCLG